MTDILPIILKGGLNLAASVLELQPGECTQLHNYETNVLGRYQRIEGYERFDGQPAPSDVDKTLLPGYPFADDASERAAVRAEWDARRAAIGMVPGEGPIRGIAIYKGTVYAFRDNVGATECEMYASSATGWQLVTTGVTLDPGGKYEFRVANFLAGSTTFELFGVDGVNPAFKFDGTTFTQITTGYPAADEKPIHLEVLPSQILMLAYRGGTVQYSALGDPMDWNVANGAGEIGVSAEVVGMDIQASNACAIFCRNRTYVLYGAAPGEGGFELTTLSNHTGAVEWSIQTIANSLYADDRGVVRLDRVQEFGNFDMATISQKIEPLMDKYLNRITASFVIREKNQFRLCFDDGYGVILTLWGDSVMGFSTFDFEKVIRCTASEEDENGKEMVFFGSDDGYLYQVDRGLSFDGAAYTSSIRPAFIHLGAPDQKKRWRKLVIEVDTTWQSSLVLAPDFDYSDPDVPAANNAQIVAVGGGGYWDLGAWDEFRWSSSSTFTADVYLDGVSRNITLFLYNTADDEPPHIFNSLLLHYSMRGRRR